MMNNFLEWYSSLHGFWQQILPAVLLAIISIFGKFISYIFLTIRKEHNSRSEFIELTISDINTYSLISKNAIMILFLSIAFRSLSLMIYTGFFTIILFISIFAFQSIANLILTIIGLILFSSFMFMAINDFRNASRIAVKAIESAETENTKEANSHK